MCAGSSNLRFRGSYTEVMTKIRRFMYTRIAKPVLFSFNPDQVHHMTMQFLSLAGGVPGLPRVVEAFSVTKHPELETDWHGMHFSSPVGLSAGMDKNGQAVPIMKAVGFGFAEVGSVTARACDGNPRPWFYRLPKTKSLVVHAGLANHGVNVVLARLEKLSRSFRESYPKILSIARTNDELASTDEAGLEDFLITVKKALASPAVQIIELNISCPNAFAGERFTDPALFTELLRRVAELKPHKQVFVKMPIELTWEHTKTLIDIADASGIVTGLVYGNLKKDRSDVTLKDDLPDSIEGGLSGAPTRQKSTELVFNTYEEYGNRFVIVGVGGILTPKDAYEKIKAGATFVELITGLIMNGPQFIEEVNNGLVDLMKRDGFTHISEVVGAAHRGKRTA